MSNYTQNISKAAELINSNGESWNAIDAESVARMKAQNRFQTGIEIAKYNAKIMREDMAAYDADNSNCRSKNFSLQISSPSH